MSHSRAVVRRASAALAALVLTVGLAACDDPDEDAEPTPSASVATDAPSEVAEVSDSPSPSESTDPVVGCLTMGDPWRISTNDMEDQFATRLSGLDLIDVTITGGATLRVSPDLVATYTPNRVTRVRVNLGDGLTMVLTQRHLGTATGQWVLGEEEGTLTSPESWSGNLRVSTTVTINGRSSDQSIDLPVAGLSDVPVTYSCDPGQLMMTAEGSPFNYLFLLR
jgi:hypothetical protein